MPVDTCKLLVMSSRYPVKLSSVIIDLSLSISSLMHDLLWYSLEDSVQYAHFWPLFTLSKNGVHITYTHLLLHVMLYFYSV